MIALRNITKWYKIKNGRHYVFRNLSYEFPDGKNVGIIGPNGAGKSTLLRLIGGIDKPDSGKVETDKRISWPVGLGGGFQPSMTGRENAKFVCRLYLRKEQIPEQIAFVREFADIGSYFDMPIKTYSSGMKARLTFALSMAFDFDYYLMDEIRAVGDADFKRKSKEALEKKRGKSNFLIVTHTMATLKEMCDCVLFLDHGQLTAYEDMDKAVEVYQNYKRRPEAA